MIDPGTRLNSGTSQIYTEERPYLRSKTVEVRYFITVSESICFIDSVDFVNAAKPNGLSTLSGVFAPVAISMFSVLLFLRMGFVVGQLGFLQTVAQLFLAYAIVMLTVLSLCAISSNDMISRSLGPEFGGAIGLLFYTANVFSCALYISGFTEALLGSIGEENSPSSASWKFLFCVLVSFIQLLLCLLGAKLFAKTAFITFSVISICYVTFLLSVFIIAPFDVPSNISDPSSEKIPDFNQTLKASYTGLRDIRLDVKIIEIVEHLLENKIWDEIKFRFATLSKNMLTNYTFDYTTSKPTDFAVMFAIIFSGITVCLFW
ncbi:unnamed protein product [Onchocerca flexuosa]|uniref:AA_permease domain-containing protein n=1 Tax=Onchocerca flexuosa TaxID=387005 RepID=A0A183HCV8_9BILA|nr:unnamed protein product [Onchocerca flexuosa]